MPCHMHCYVPLINILWQQKVIKATSITQWIRATSILRTYLLLSVGFGPVLFPPRGAFVITPSIACHFQSILLLSLYTDNPSIHIRLNNPCFLHPWNLSCTVLDAPRLLARVRPQDIYLSSRNE